MTAWTAVAVSLVSAALFAAQASAGKTKVFVSILPQKYFVERVGGQYVEANVLVGPGQSPHTYEPTPKQLAALSDAKVYFRIGIPFENGIIDKLAGAFGNIKVVDTRKGIKLLTTTGGDTDEPAGEPDPHTWLDPRLVKVQARTICDTLKSIDSAHAADFEKNLAAFNADLDAVDAKIRTALAPLKGRDFFVYHPAFAYFAAAYGLREVPVEIEGKEPSAKQLAKLVDKAKAQNVRVIFVQPQFSTKSAEAVAQAIGGAVVPMDDLAEDYLTNLEAMAAEIRKVLAPQGGQAPEK